MLTLLEPNCANAALLLLFFFFFYILFWVFFFVLSQMSWHNLPSKIFCCCHNQFSLRTKMVVTITKNEWFIEIEDSFISLCRFLENRPKGSVAVGGPEVDAAVISVFAALVWHAQQLRDDMDKFSASGFEAFFSVNLVDMFTVRVILMLSGKVSDDYSQWVAGLDIPPCLLLFEMWAFFL